MMFVVIFLFPLLAYVFIPGAYSSRDVNTDSDKTRVELSAVKTKRDNPATAEIDSPDHQQEESKNQRRHKVRHGMYRSDKRRHSVSDISDKNAKKTDDEASVTEAAEPESVTDVEDHLDLSSVKTDVSSQAIPDPGVAIDINNYTDSDSQEIENGTEINRTSHYPTGCPKCGAVEEQKQFHVEMFKSTLLQKLGMATAPKVGGPLPPLPFDFYLGEDFSVSDEPDEEEEDRTAVKTREVFIFGTDVTERCHNQKGTGCYSFNLTDKGLDPYEVASIELWIYKQQDLNDHHIQTFMVSELDKSSKKVDGEPMLRLKNIAKRFETRLKYGWMKIYLRRTVMRWMSKPQRNNGLAVVCKTCQRQNHKTIYGNKEGMMPILVFYMRQNKHRRRRYRRETQCIEGGNNCCHKETLVINFRDIGWDYIMAPLNIRPNFCTGSCNGIQAAYYNHTRLVQTLQQSVMHNYGSQLQPCCSPVSFRHSQSLIYRDHHGVVRKIDIPDLIVGDCGCT